MYLNGVNILNRNGGSSGNYGTLANPMILKESAALPITTIDSEYGAPWAGQAYRPFCGATCFSTNFYGTSPVGNWVFKVTNEFTDYILIHVRLI